MRNHSYKSKQFTLAILSLSVLINTAQLIAITRDANNYSATQAQVRIGSDLCEQEIDYINARLPKIKASLESALSMTLADDEIPHIAICSSGGGYRAMIGTLGSFAGMQTTKTRVNNRSVFSYLNPVGWVSSASSHILGWMGYQQEAVVDDTLFAQSPASLLDACMYTAVLSGSTWSLAGWMQSRLAINNYITRLCTQVGEPLTTNVNMELVAEQLLFKESNNQDVSIVDIYGALLAQKLLNDLGANNANDINIVDYQNVIDAAQVPLPISTSVIGNATEDYEWVEFTPYEVGSTYLNAFIPAWSFGRQFNRGSSVDFAPPQSLGFCMGVWGSAFAVDAKDVYSDLIEPEMSTLSCSYIGQKFGTAVSDASHLFQSIYDKLDSKRIALCRTDLDQERIAAAQVHNWALNLANTPLNTAESLELVDGGLSINLPFPPLLRPERNVNIIIVLDNSSGTLASELPKTEQYAKAHSLKFPPINYSLVGNTISVHKDPNDTTVPVVIYMPLVANAAYQKGWDPRNASFTSTFNFEYSNAQFGQLAGLTQFTMQQNQAVILETIKEWIEEQRG